MGGIYIPGDKVPTKCVGCPFRDPEYGGNCVLMPSFDADTYDGQFDRCPFKELRKWFGSVPEHGRLIDADALEDEAITYYALPVLAVNSIGPEAELVLRLRDIDSSPTIIPADPPVMFYPQVPGITPTVISDKEVEG